MAETSEELRDRDEQVAIYLKKRMIGRGRCEVKSGPDGPVIRLQYIQWLDGYEPPFPFLEQLCTIEFEDDTRISGVFQDVLSGARPREWLRFTQIDPA
jgi:hypothetical protein